MNAGTLKEFLASWVSIEAQGPHGEIQQRERIQAVAELVAQAHAGDFVEIGVLHGSTTVMLAEVARRYGRHVIAVDPFEIGTQNCFGGELEIFERNIAPYADVIEFWRVRSDDALVSERLATRKLAFAFIDGLHTFEACSNDLLLMQNAPVIAVDDTLWSEEVARAAREYVARWIQPPRTLIEILRFRESWIV